MTGIFFGLCIALLQIATPLVNSLGVLNLNDNIRRNYGVARGIGSAAYAVVAYVIGVLADEFGGIVVPIVIAVVFLMFVIAVWRFPFLRPEPLHKETVCKEGARREADVRGRNTVQEFTSGAVIQEEQTSTAFYKKYPGFCLVLAGCILLYISHVLLNSFTFRIVQSKGGGSLIDRMGVNAMLIFATVCSLGGMLIVCFCSERKSR